MNTSVVHYRLGVCTKLNLFNSFSPLMRRTLLPDIDASQVFFSSPVSDYVCVTLVDALQKNQRELAKMKKCLRPEELVSHMGQMDTQAQQEELEKSYQITLEDYRRILERLASQA